VEIENTIWVQLANNEWIYFSPSTDSFTILCSGREPIDAIHIKRSREATH
jgi:hypothetical protein